MLNLLGVITVAVIPFALTAILLLLCGRHQDVLAARVARQVEITDAIHRELGAVMAPLLTKGSWGRYRLVMPAPLEQPGLVARALAIAYRVLRSWDAKVAERVQIVVVPRSS